MNIELEAGINTHYVHAIVPNSKGTIICVHGIGSFSDQFEGMSEYLGAQGYSVMRYDLMGRGRSDFPRDNRFDGEAHVAQLRHLILKLSLNDSKYHLICHSMGGGIGALYASKYPDEIASLILLSPAGLMDLGPLRLVRGCCGCFQSIVRKALTYTQETAWRSGFESHEGASKVEEDAFIEKMIAINIERPLMFEAFWQSALQFPLSGLDDSVEKVAISPKLSVLVMWGKKDKDVPFKPNYLRWKNYFDAHLSKDEKVTEYVVYDTLGHAFPLESPAIVNADINKFLLAVDSKRT